MGSTGDGADLTADRRPRPRRDRRRVLPVRDDKVASCPHGVYALRINSDAVRWIERDADTVPEKLPRARGDRYVGLVLLFDAGDEQVTFPNNIGIGAQFAGVGAFAYRAAVEDGSGRNLDTDRFSKDRVR